MAAINILFFSDRRKGDSPETERSILCEVHYLVNGKRCRIKFPTGQKCKLKHLRDGRVWHTVAFAVQINDRLHELRDKAERIYREAIERKKMPTPQRFRELILQEAYEVKLERDFLEDFNAFIDYHANKGSSLDVVLKLRRLSRLLQAFNQRDRFVLSYENMNLDFYARFLKFLSKEKGRYNVLLNENTKGAYVRKLKMFLEWAFRCGYNHATMFKQFKLPKEKVDNHYFTAEELENLIKLDLSRRPELARDRDWFILACHTGMRISDYPQLKRENIQEVKHPTNGETLGYNFRYYATKTSRSSGVRPVVPLSKECVRILMRYGWDMPRIPEAPPFRRNLKKIGVLAGLEKDIKPHDARRTFATLEYLAGTPKEFIMRITGHKTEQEFRKYLCLDGEENAQHVRDMHPERFEIKTPGLKDNHLRIA